MCSAAYTGIQISNAVAGFTNKNTFFFLLSNDFPKDLRDVDHSKFTGLLQQGKTPP